MAQTVSYELPVSYAVIYFEKEQSELSESALEKLASMLPTLARISGSHRNDKGICGSYCSIAYNMALIAAFFRLIAELKRKFRHLAEKISIQPGSPAGKAQQQSPKGEI